MKRTLIGAGYGLVLLFLSIIIAGAGHGIYTAVVISASPLPPPLNFLMSPPAALVGAYIFLGIPLIWAGIAFLTQSVHRWSFPAAIIVHYVAAVWYVARMWNEEFHDPYKNFQLLHYVAPYLIAFGAIYLGGQIWLWYAFAKSSHQSDPATLTTWLDKSSI
jgi:hypothetical protein